MKIKQINEDAWQNRRDEWRDYHVVCIAEEGFSMLNYYVEKLHGQTSNTIHAFAHRVNSRRESGSLSSSSAGERDTPVLHEGH